MTSPISALYAEKFKLRYKGIYHGNCLKVQLAFTVYQDCLCQEIFTEKNLKS